MDCVEVAEVRHTFNNINNLYDLFRNVVGDTYINCFFLSFPCFFYSYISPYYSINKLVCSHHDINEILLKLALNIDQSINSLKQSL